MLGGWNGNSEINTACVYSQGNSSIIISQSGYCPLDLNLPHSKAAHLTQTHVHKTQGEREKAMYKQGQ